MAGGGAGRHRTWWWQPGAVPQMLTAAELEKVLRGGVGLVPYSRLAWGARHL